MQTLINLIKEAASNNDCEFRNNYSGRAMYGDRCVGIVGDSRSIAKTIGEVIKTLYDQTYDFLYDAVDGSAEQVAQTASTMQRDFHKAIDAILNQREDSMGRSDQIVYWPELTNNDEGSDDEVEEE